MSPVPESTHRELARCWQRFAEIIRMFAEQRTARNEISQQEYESIHGGLLQSLEKAMEAAPERQELYAEMKEVAEPWINIEAFKQAETPLLKDLVTRCDDLDRQLTSRAAARLSTGVSLTILVGVFLAAFALVLGMDIWSGLYDGVLDGSGGRLAEWLDALERNQDNSRSWLIGIVVGVVTTVVAMLVFRAPRTY